MDDPVSIVDDHSRMSFRAGFWAPTRGVRLPEDRRDLVARCTALVAATGAGVTFSGLTALELWGGVESDPRCVELTIPDDAHQIRRLGHRCRRRGLSPEDVATLHGLAVTTPARTFVDVADRLSVPRLVAVGDDLLARRLVSRADLEVAMRQSSGQRGVRKVRQAVPLLDARAESPRESLVRALLALGGFVAPEVQWEVRDGRGRFVARVDLAYVDERIAIEYDGEHHLSRERQAVDARRRLELGAEGWLVVTVVSEDVRQPRSLYAKVDRALRARRSLSPIGVHAPQIGTSAHSRARYRGITRPLLRTRC